MTVLFRFIMLRSVAAPARAPTRPTIAYDAAWGWLGRPSQTGTRGRVVARAGAE